MGIGTTKMQEFVNSYLDFNLGYACVIGISIFLCYLSYVQKVAAVRRRRMRTQEIAQGILLTIYLVVLLGGTVLNRHYGEEFGVKLQLFWSYIEVFEKSKIGLAWQIVLNVLAFIPWGILFAHIWKGMRRPLWNVGSAFCFSALIELIQLVFRCGFFEFDDMFHNTLGALIGYGIWRWYMQMGQKRKMRQKCRSHRRRGRN